MAVQKVRAKTEYQILIIQQKQHPLCVLFTVEYEDDKEFCYLLPVEKTVIDRCIHQIYQKYFENPGPENMPLLEDLYKALLKQKKDL